MNQNHHHSHNDDKHDHNRHVGHSVSMFKRRFWVTLVLTIPVLLYSEMIQKWLGFSMPVFSGSIYVPLVLGSIIFFYGGLVFIRGAIGEIRARMPGMMTLVSIAIVAAYAWSIVATFFVEGGEFFWELSTLIVAMLLGHWFEMASVAGASRALDELAKLLPDTAEVIQNGKSKNQNDNEKIKIVPVSELRKGNLVLVRPGGRIPVDGVVREGESAVNEAMITGESKLVGKKPGVSVIAGTVNTSGSLTIEVTKVGAETALAGIMRLVAEAQASRSRTQLLADRAAFYLTVTAIIVGAITLVGWTAAGRGFSFAMERLVTVLVIACPHALGVAVPLVTAISTTLAAKNGILIKKREALENARTIGTVLFDKTGTLTFGTPSVTDIWPLETVALRDVLSLTASVEALSEHPLGQAIVTEGKRKKIRTLKAHDFRSLPGEGVEAIVSGKHVLIGSLRTFAARKIPVPATLRGRALEGEKEGKTAIFVSADGTVLGAIALGDAIRPESHEAIAHLKRLGKRVAMLTGDAKGVAASVAGKLGVDEYFAEVLPADKVEKVKVLSRAGRGVAMVGDGVNDAPALAAADIGIAIGAGTDVAIESADVVLMKSDPRDVAKVFALSRATYRKMLQNLWWAAGYNIVAIPLAAGVLAPWGIILPPAVGAILMSVSTIVVAANAQLLRRVKL